MNATRTAAFRWGLRLFGTGYVVFLIAIPAGGIVWKALGGGAAAAVHAVTTAAAVHALVLTVWTGAIALGCNTVFGVGIALVLARRSFVGKGLIEAVIDLPLSLSPVVAGLALVLFYSQTEGVIGPFLTDHAIMVIFSFPGIVLAAAFVSLPYVVREVLPVLQEIGTEQEQAAQTLGARPFTVFRRITLPAIRWGLAYGVLLTTARILGEFGAMSIVSGNIIGHTQTFTQFVDTDFQQLDFSGAYAGALLLALISIVLLVALSATRRSRELETQ